jgi:CBS domain-containing protein
MKYATAPQINLNMKVQQILDRKPKNEILSVTPDTMVFHALEELEKHNIGALLVMEGDKLVGIFSERDYARRGILKGRPSRESMVKDLMTSPVITVSPQTRIEECLTLMTEKHFRHLPVVVGVQVTGMISSSDIFRAILTQYQNLVSSLEGYIAGRPM